MRVVSGQPQPATNSYADGLISDSISGTENVVMEVLWSAMA